MLYFAYGSNLNWSQMKERCPSVRFVGKALLKGYKFDFTRKSFTRGCGVMDIVKQVHGVVWGVVYQIDELDLGKLDKSEGYAPGRQKNAYQRIECVVYEDGDDKKPITAYTYEVIDKSANTVPPNLAYKSLFVNGAEYWHLPDRYVDQLKLIESVELFALIESG